MLYQNPYCCRYYTEQQGYSIIQKKYQVGKEKFAMSKRKKILLLTLILTLLFSVNVWGASNYSYNNIGLNYGKSSGGFYGAGKMAING